MIELNIDGLIGPTHNFGGLSLGNIASMESKGTLSRPRKAALQGLYKMKMLHDLGIAQAVLPPQERPDIPTLRQLGFWGSDAQVLESAYKESPLLVAECSAASSAWAANAATVTPSCDAQDGRVHVTPANLISRFHRSIEPLTTGYALHEILKGTEAFTHHEPLPAHPNFGDEGMANQIRLDGMRMFVYGKDSGKFPARQTLGACQALARQHELRPDEVIFAQQSPDLIDAGAFHNDLVAVGAGKLLLVYEDAWVGFERIVEQLRETIEVHVVKREQLPTEKCIRSYLFNSQLVGDRILIAPIEARDHEAVIKQLPISKVLYFDLKESMKNGGGPACLRLPLLLTKSEFQGVHPGVLMNDSLYHELVAWVNQFYREELIPSDLADPALLVESREALLELLRILDLPPLYPFQAL